ncbi:VPLPA-CTERM sorting domain-containing protein [Roseovarius aestuariivivens]|uniref:VPLPA-CTERM sorting domain-containing protein n=1 Tax=Roseovarius aestuariivivens TaxID=1888910 RepID=UPI001081DB44
MNFYDVDFYQNNGFGFYFNYFSFDQNGVYRSSDYLARGAFDPGPVYTYASLYFVLSGEASFSCLYRPGSICGDPSNTQSSGQATFSPARLEPVPVPAGITLLLTGVAGFASVRARQERKPRV